MTGNYNDVIDIILTFVSDYELNEAIAISKDVVPYLILNKEFKEHLDFDIYVKENKLNMVRRKVKKLTKIYEFDIISDSLDYIEEDFGFKIEYNDTKVNFIPHSLIDDTFFSKHYHVNEEAKTVKLTKKEIKGITKNSAVKKIELDGYTIRIMSPEFVLTMLELKNNKNLKTMELLSDISDETVLKALRKNVSKQIVTKEEIKIKNKKYFYFIIPLIIIILILIIIIIKR